MSRFDRDTALEPVGDGRFSGRVDRGWWIFRGPNGGYLAAIMLRAFTLATDDPARHARSLTVHFVRPPHDGPVTIDTRVERSGRSLTTLSGRMTQDDRLIALGLAAFSVPFEGFSFDDTVMPEAPAPETLEPRPEREGDIEFTKRFDFRWAIGTAPMGSGGDARSGAWMRLADPRVADAAVVALMMDAWAPAVFAKVVPPAGVPTIDMTVHFRRPLPVTGARPDDYLLGVFESKMSHDGFVEEDGRLWTPDGVLVAQSRQLALLLPGRT